MQILTVETTCDETAAAVVTEELRVLSSVVASQDQLHRRFAGVVPEIAARAHVERILPVIDIKKLFGLAEQGLTDLHRIVLIRGHGLELGLLADVIVGTRSLRADGLQPSLPTLTGIRADYLRGVNEERLVVLDLDRILTDPSLIVHEEVNS